MRYRSFGPTGKAVSAVSLLLREAPNMTTPGAWRGLAFSAMENGVNCFEVTAGVDVIALGMGEALRAVERRLIFLGYRLRGDGRTSLSAQDISQSVKRGLEQTGAGHFDLLMMDEAAYDSLAPDGLEFLGDLRAAGVALHLGVVGDGPSIDTCIRGGKFDVVETPFNLASDWRARRRIRDASAANMVMVGYDLFPSQLLAAGGGGNSLRGLGARGTANPLDGAGTYAFLNTTSSWTAEDICLAYALTEPTFATFHVEAFRPDAIARYCAAADKDLPTGVAAQIEMARFSRDALKRAG